MSNSFAITQKSREHNTVHLHYISEYIIQHKTELKHHISNLLLNKLKIQSRSPSTHITHIW